MPAQYRALWSVPGGGNGFSVMHWMDAPGSGPAQDIADAMRAFFNALTGLLPDDVQINFDTEVLVLSTAGTLIAAHSVTPPATVNGLSTAAYARPSGARVDWGTGQIVAGRRLTGRTYLVPMSSGLFDTEGKITTANASTIQTAANTLISTSAADSTDLAVWSRTHGVEHPVTNASVPQFGAILRGRRD